MLGTRDYCRKNGFTDVVIGAVRRHRLVARRGHRRRRPRRRPRARRLDAVALLERPLQVRRPCLADNLGIDYRTISIEPAFTAFLDMLGPSFEGRRRD